VDMRRLLTVTRVEKEPIRPYAQYRRHENRMGRKPGICKTAREPYFLADSCSNEMRLTCGGRSTAFAPSRPHDGRRQVQPRLGALWESAGRQGPTVRERTRSRSPSSVQRGAHDNGRSKQRDPRTTLANDGRGIA
jgi:hypothetical protein